MKKINIIFTGFILTMGWFISCSKEYSLENISNVNNEALGILVTDSAGNCSHAYVNGNYYIDNNLNSTNYALINVNVASVGKYLIKTNVSNGFYFQDSGYFNTTGVQQIELKGYGIPIVPDTTQFVFSFGNSACNFNVNNVIDTSSNPKNAFFKLSGTPDNCNNIIVAGKYNAGIAMDTGNYIITQVKAITIGTYTINTNVIDGIKFSTTGYFSQKGVQEVKIPALGTPQKNGTNSFALIGSTGNCYLNVKVN